MCLYIDKTAKKHTKPFVAYKLVELKNGVFLSPYQIYRRMVYLIGKECRVCASQPDPLDTRVASGIHLFSTVNAALGQKRIVQQAHHKSIWCEKIGGAFAILRCSVKPDDILAEGVCDIGITNTIPVPSLAVIATKPIDVACVFGIGEGNPEVKEMIEKMKYIRAYKPFKKKLPLECVVNTVDIFEGK